MPSVLSKQRSEPFKASATLPFATAAPSSPFTVIPSAPRSSLTLPSASVSLAISRTDIESLGVDVARNVGKVTEKIIAKANVGSFDDLGRLLVQVQEEAGKLDPSRYSGKKPGWWTWLFEPPKRKLATWTLIVF